MSKKYLLANGWKEVKGGYESPFQSGNKEMFSEEGAMRIEYLLKGYEYVMKKVREINEK